MLAQWRCSGAAAANGRSARVGLQVELEGEALVGFPRKLIVHGPDVSKCLLDGEGLTGYVKARAEQSRATPCGAIAPVLLFLCRVGSQGTCQTSQCVLYSSVQTRTLATFSIQTRFSDGMHMRVGGAVFSGASLLCLGEALHMVALCCFDFQFGGLGARRVVQSGTAAVWAAGSVVLKGVSSAIAFRDMANGSYEAEYECEGWGEADLHVRPSD